MLAFDFDYYKPSSMEEAVNQFKVLKRTGKSPMYFSGGTEIITLGRLNYLYADSVIDIKSIPECCTMDFEHDNLYLGSAITLAEIEGSDIFPLLSKVSSEVGDHTSRTKITLGGNICGDIFYREAVLPFLLADSVVFIAEEDGIQAYNINEIFNEELKKKEGDLLVQVVTEKKYVTAPHITIKRQKQWESGYPVITASALKINSNVRVAISGLCPFPFRSREMEETLNNRSVSIDQRIKLAMTKLPEPILSDTEASDKYRLFVLSNVLHDILQALEVS
ncbi:xanthine dehydrogenase family protein subunit M [Evansella sp. AB-rgal1]|uniref:FAD binding domain-containing protein n=1 Tax=Evansella sp. AB-rgal1 TaxID=3242696 RepID=UPI00359E9E5D